jgi:Spy/CpxP family protein refolding chaperone
MPKIVLLSLLTLWSTLPTIAQGPPTDVRERVEAAKMGFITREVKLSPDEAKVFWPIYEAYHAELRSVERDPMDRDRREIITDDAEALKVLKSMEATAEKREAIRKKYQKKFLEILPAHKVLAYYRAEREFQRRLNERLREGRSEGGRPGGPGGPPPGSGGRRPGGPGPQRGF